MRTPYGRAFWLSLAALGVLTGGVAQALNISGVVSKNTTYTAARNPYVLRESPTVSPGVTLTIEPGVRMVAAGNHRIYVQGTLRSSGTPADPIICRGLDPYALDGWEGLYVAAGGRCDLLHTTIKNATTALTAVDADLVLDDARFDLSRDDGLMAWGKTHLQAINSSFKDNGRRGLYLEGFEVTGSITDCLFRSNGEYPAYLKATVAEVLRTGNRYESNGRQRVAVSCSLTNDITDEDTWTPQAVPFDTAVGSAERTLTVGAAGKLTFEAGVTVHCQEVEVRGELVAVGTPAARCQLLSPNEPGGPGQWEGVTFRPGSRGELARLILAHARTGLTIDGATVRLTSSTIGDCAADGLRATGATALTAISVKFTNNGRDGLRLEGPEMTGVARNCTFTGQGRFPVWALASNVRLLGAGNVCTANHVQAIGVSCHEDPDLASGTHRWTGQPVPLDCSVNPLGAALSIGPGASLQIGPGLTILSAGVSARGRLDINGVSSNPVVFGPCAANPTPGDWAGLSFLEANGSVSGAVIEYGATGLALSSSSPSIRESIIRYSQYDGLRCRGDSSPIVTTTQILGSGRHGVLIEQEARPNLGDLDSATTDDDGRNRLLGSGGYNVYNATGNAIMAQNNWWDSTDATAIGASIFDHDNNPLRGVVRYEPFPPDVTNLPPVLTWTGGAGLETDGLDPEVGAPTQTLRLAICYTDPEGSPPAYLRAHLSSGGVEIAASPIALEPCGATNYAAGVLYAADVSLPAGREYRYWFSAGDGQNAATGIPTTPRAGPLVNTPPELVWRGAGDWTADGLDPETAPAGTLFHFRCVYRDADGDPPSAIVCHLTQDGSPINKGPYEMKVMQGDDYREGVVYEYHRKFGTPALYSYRFEASDGIATATGLATVEVEAPGVTAPEATSPGGAIWARQTRGGAVEIRWRLAAPAAVSLRVLNLAGRPVSTVLEASPQPAGQGTAFWSGKTRTGSLAPSGAYLLAGEVYAANGQRQTILAPFRLRR